LMWDGGGEVSEKSDGMVVWENMLNKQAQCTDLQELSVVKSVRCRLAVVRMW